MKQFIAIFNNSFKYLWRNPLNVTVFVFFPLLIILILGTALSAYITPENDFDPISVAYVTDNEESVFAELLKGEFTRFLSANFTNEEHARELLESGDIYIVIIEKEGELSALKSNSASAEINVALSIIDSYKKTAAAVEIAILNGQDPLKVMGMTNIGFSVEAKPIGKRVPTAIDYYTVTMVVYMLMLAGINGLDLFSKSLISDTGGRIMTSPVSKPVLILGLLAGSTITSFLQSMVTLVFTSLFYGVYWGERIPWVLLTLFVLVLFSQAVAMFLILLFRKSGPAMGIMQSVFWTTTFVSKGFAKVSFGEQADRIFAYAPNALAQTSIFGFIYGGNEDKMFMGILLLAALAAVFYIMAFLVGRRRFA